MGLPFARNSGTPNLDKRGRVCGQHNGETISHRNARFCSPASHRHRCLSCSSSSHRFIHMEIKVVVKITSIIDDKSRRKAMEAVAEIYGINSIAVDMKEQKLTVVGDMDAVAIAKKLRKFGKVEVESVAPAKEKKVDDKKEPAKKDDKKKDDKKEPAKKEEKKDEKKDGKNK